MYSVKILKDSISDVGNRVTTWELTYPRFVHCFDDETEILSQVSNETPLFRKFSDAKNLGCKVAQVNKSTFEIDFIAPLEWISSRYSGTMVSFSNQRLDFKVTPNHRLLVGSRKLHYDKIETVEAKSLLNDFTQKRFFKTGYLKNRSKIEPALAMLVAFFISDGHIPKEGRRASFHFKKQRKINRVISLLSYLDVEFTIQLNSDKTTTIWFPIEDWMRECYTEIGEKTVPSSIWNMDRLSFLEFKQGLLESDGCVRNSEFNSFSEILINSLQAIFHLNNESFNIRKYGPCFKVKFQKEKTPVVRKDKQKPLAEYYSGLVHCVRVPEGFVLVRRNGIVHISGNSELMTHRVFSRNAASSRAIPIGKFIRRVIEDPVLPVFWGKNQSGMQSKEELSPEEIKKAKELILSLRDISIRYTEELGKIGLHKQISNRYLEPWLWITVILSGTDFSNCFALRDHNDAQPELREAIHEMHIQYKRQDTLDCLDRGEWHIPLCDFPGDKKLSLKDRLKVATGRCARVSYLTHSGIRDVEADIILYDRLLTSGHMSPFEHCAKAMGTNKYYGNFKGFKQLRKYIPNESK